jgi:hypothetical protein
MGSGCVGLQTLSRSHIVTTGVFSNGPCVLVCQLQKRYTEYSGMEVRGSMRVLCVRSPHSTLRLT